MRHEAKTRRSVMFGLGAAVAASAVGGRTAVAQTQAAGAFRPARHPQDSWMDALPGTHRVFIDATTAPGAGEAFLYANNLYAENKAAYSIAERDLAIVICLRHFATVFGYADAVWAKYGKVFSEMLPFTDPKTKQAPTTNLYNSAAYGMSLPNFGNTIEAQSTRGTRFAICDAATHFMSLQLAGAGLGTEDAIYKELVANTVPNSRMVSAGVFSSSGRTGRRRRRPAGRSRSAWPGESENPIGGLARRLPASYAPSAQ